MKKFLTKLCLLVALASGALAATNTVSGIAYNASGQPGSGNLFISWTSFQGVDGHQVPAGSLTVPVRNGVYSVALEPNDTNLPTGTFYTVTYSLLGGARNLQEFWIVPTTPSPAHWTDVYTVSAPATSFIVGLGQLASGGASNGNCLVWFSVPGRWQPSSGCGGGGGGSPTFDSILSGVNVLASMTVGSGATLTFTGTGIINASKILGSAPSGVTGTGNVVFGNTPTIITPVIASFFNAGHNHQNATGGGVLAEAALAFTDITTGNATSLAHGFLPKLTGSSSDCFLGDGTYGSCTGGGGGANTALSNLGTVSINTSLLAQAGVDLGSTVKPFRDLFLFGGGTFGTNYFHFTGTPTAARTFTLPDASGTLTALGNTQTGSGALVGATSPTLVTPILGVASATSLNKVAITAPATGATITIVDGKTLTATNTLNLAGPDGVTVTFQGTDTYVGRTTTDTLTNKTLTTPTIGSFVNADHNHTNAAGGGQLTDAALSAAVTVPKGGTGLTSITANALTKGAGTSAEVVTGVLVDASNNIATPGSESTGVGSGLSGAKGFIGATSGAVWFAARDAAGTPITYYLPSTNGATGQYLYDAGAITCDANLPATAPTTCHVLAWAGSTGTLGNVVNSGSPTIVTPTIASFVNSNHDHSNSAGGGNLAASALGSGAKTGTGTKLATATAAGTAGNCAQWDASGNISDAGAACGTGSGGGSGSGFVGYSSGALTLTGTLFFPYTGGLAPSSTEANVDAEAPGAGTIANFYVQLSAAPGLTNSIVFTWRKAGSSQTLTCTISGASATSCNDTTHSFTVAAGDLLDIQAVVTGSIVGTPNIVIVATVGPFTISGSGTIDFSSIPDGTCATNTFTATGAVTGDAVAPSWPSSLETGLFGTMLVTASNTVQVRLCNLNGSAVDPASQSFAARIVR